MTTPPRRPVRFLREPSPFTLAELLDSAGMEALLAGATEIPLDDSVVDRLVQLGYAEYVDEQA